MAVTRQAAASGGAQRSPMGRVLLLGGGFEGDVVAECFESSDVAAFLGGGRDSSVVVVGSEVVEPGVGVGQEVPDHDQDGASDCDDGLLLSAAPCDASVAGAEEGVGAAG